MTGPDRIDPRTALDRAGIHYRLTPRGELEFNCIACGHARAAVNATSGAYYCFACNASGHASALDRITSGSGPSSTHRAAQPKPERYPVGPKIEHKYLTETGYHFASVYRQYYHDGTKSMWSKSLNGFTEEQKREMFSRYPYRLPQVLDAIRFDGRVYIVEGEKCADALLPHISGSAVTCNPGGAGKWTDAHSAWFKYVVPADVVILPDNDEPGRRHAEQVAASLYRTCTGIQIRIASLPNLSAKQDIGLHNEYGF